MLADLTMKIGPEMIGLDDKEKAKRLFGHWGTHFDVMDKEFPLEYTERKGIVFDVREISAREIGVADICADEVEKDMFVAFCSGFSSRERYGEKRYFAEHPQLSHELIGLLLDKGVSIIGVDFAGVRRGGEHVPTDQHCADRGVFIVENLCNLEMLLAEDAFTVCTYPLNAQGMTGLPCRVIAKI